MNANSRRIRGGIHVPVYPDGAGKLGASLGPSTPILLGSAYGSPTTSGRTVRVLLAGCALLTAAVGGCASLRTDGVTNATTVPPSVELELRRALHAQPATLTILEATLPPLPRDFHLNPNRSRDQASRGATGLPFVTKDPGVLVSTRHIHGSTVMIRVTPVLGPGHEAALWVSRDVFTNAQESAAVEHEEFRLQSSHDDRPAVLATASDGRVQKALSSDWGTVIALAGRRGLIAWSPQADDDLPGARAGGFRRFHLDGPSRGQGWPLLRPDGEP